MIVGWLATPWLLLVLLPAIAIAYCMMMVSGQLVLTTSMGLLRSRRFRDLTIVFLSLLGSSCYVINRGIESWLRAADTSGLEGLEPLLYLRWLPPGACAQAVASAGSGAWVDAGWRGPRKVLNISSGLGRRAMASQAPYCAAYLSILGTMYGSFIPALSEHHSGGVNVGRALINGERLGGTTIPEQYFRGSQFARDLRAIDLRGYRDLYRTYGVRSFRYAEMVFGNTLTVRQLRATVPQERIFAMRTSRQVPAGEITKRTSLAIGGGGRRDNGRRRRAPGAPGPTHGAGAGASVLGCVRGPRGGSGDRQGCGSVELGVARTGEHRRENPRHPLPPHDLRTDLHRIDLGWHLALGRRRSAMDVDQPRPQRRASKIQSGDVRLGEPAIAI